MTLARYRKTHNLTLEAFAAQLGKSKSYLCEIEKSGRAPVALAMEIERVTRGQVDAASLNPDIDQIRKAAA